MNPEFLRNLLLELTLHRLIAMPAILLLIYSAASLTGNHDAVSETARFVMIAVLVPWGTRLAADVILGEVASRTWDSQRMSSLGPWSMGWAKLFGGTIAVWYCTILSVPAFFYDGALGTDDLARVLLLGLFAQAVALFTSLVVLRQRVEKMRFQVTFAQLMGIGGALLLWNLLEWDRGTVDWYGIEAARGDLMFVSGIAFLAWTCFGIYRLLRAELQFRCWPVGWTGFALFCAAYAGGFASDEIRGFAVESVPGLDALQRMLAAYAVIVGLTWAAAYAEPKGFVRLRRWGGLVRSGSLSRILDATPAWAPGLAAALVLCIVLVATWGMSSDARAVFEGYFDMESLAAFAAALFLFLLRDIGVVHLLTLDGRARRGQLAALVYLAVLYLLLPLLLYGLDLEGALPVLIPYAEGNAAVIVLPVLLQVAVVAGLLVARWRLAAERMAAG